MAQFKFGNYDFPDKYIEWGSVSIAPNQRQTLDSYTDMLGETHMFPVPHTKTQIKFTTLSMSADEMRTIMNNITANYIDRGKRDLNCKYYDDEYGGFKTGHFYLDQSLEFPRKKVDLDGVPLIYDKMQWLFIEL